MIRKAKNSEKPSGSASSQKGLEYNRELAIGTILVVVLLVLLAGFCIATTLPLGQLEMTPSGAYESTSTPPGGGGNAGMTLQQALKRAL